ncbi:MAG TPA: M48 family metallopeptidase, partial [Candidatus Hodarchaeales archaeon]|nr:M48 family metallopeptidase [Candidatus Hodarchaeales archaeon]
NISTRLLFAPDEVLEYVCIHELAHLIEHNHSDRFWALVEKAMPYYPQQKQWLKEHGESIRF